MTVEEAKASKKVFLSPVEFAPIANMSPQTIRVYAEQAPDELLFPTMRTGTRTRIPRILALRALGYEVEA